MSDGKKATTQSFTITVKAVEPDPEIVLTGITVKPKTMTLFAGESKAIKSVTATYKIKGIEVLVDLGECDYVSSATGIAKVSDIGLVSAIAKGIATITVTYGGMTDTCAVTVTAAPIVADLTAYNAALAAVTETDYTTESWTAYQLVVAANVVTAQNTQAEVNTATLAIMTAQGDLVSVAEIEAAAAVAAVNEAETSVELNAALANEVFEGYDVDNYDAYFASLPTLFTGSLADVAAVDAVIEAVNTAEADHVDMEIKVDMPIFEVDVSESGPPVGITSPFTIEVVANDDVDKEKVLFFLTLPEGHDASPPIYTIVYWEDTIPGWVNLIELPEGLYDEETGEVIFGGVGGPLIDEVLLFKGTFNAAGTYKTTVEVWEVDEDGEKVGYQPLCSKDITATVVPVIPES
ncbi:hypothetical protein ES708_31226 [subsurface metagenome]